MAQSGLQRQREPKGLNLLLGVIDTLRCNQRELQRNLEQAARRLPFAHIGGGGGSSGGGGVGKAPPHKLPAALAAALAGLSSAAAAVTSPPPAPKQQRRKSGGWMLFRKADQAAAADGQPAAAEAAAAAAAAAAGPEVVCIEYTKGKRRVYRRRQPTEESGSGEGGEPAAGTAPVYKGTSCGGVGSSGGGSGSSGGSGFEIVDDLVLRRQRLGDIAKEYLLPQGYPESVAPEYTDYMFWRGVQYFFGGAMSVFTTRSLLTSLGVANKRSSEAAAAINWVVKDGAGRLGRFLFARWGRELDCELKQFRLAGDVLMEAGAALELSTVLMPTWFLPLACTANLAKNLAAVAASSTRAPIYRTFALQNNLADVTAKGESVANLADVVGTAFGIALAKMNLPVLPTFCILSVGYLVASRREVDSVVLPYLNRARLSYAARAFYSTGAVPDPLEANGNEPLMPWSDPHSGRVVLGATVEEACPGPQQLQEALNRFSGRQYALTYRPDTRKCYVLLKQHASAQSVLEAAMTSHCLLWMLDQQRSAPPAAAAGGRQQPQQQQAAQRSTRSGGGGSSGSGVRACGAGGGSCSNAGGSRVIDRLHAAAQQIGSGTAVQQAEAASGGAAAGQGALEFVASSGREVCQQFERQAAAGGWRMRMTMLNPHETRLAIS